MNTLRLFPGVDFPLVPILCGQYGGSRASCDRCNDERELLVDEVLEVDTVLDEAAFEVHFSYRQAHFARLRAQDSTRPPWPPRQPTAVESANIAQLQTDYLFAMVNMQAPEKAA